MDAGARNHGRDAGSVNRDTQPCALLAFVPAVSFLSRINKIAGASKGVFHSFDFVKDAATALHLDDAAEAVGHAFNAFKQSTRASTAVVHRTTSGGIAMDRNTATALNVKTQPLAPGENLAGAAQTIETGLTSVAYASSRAKANISDLLDAPLGDIPEPARRVIADVSKVGYHSFADPVSNAINAANTIYDKGISQPLSFVVLASELKADPVFMKDLEGKSFSEQQRIIASTAWKAARHTSPGQAIGYGFAGNHVDITDQATVDRVANSSLYHDVSGLVDAGLRVYADPVAIGAGRIKAANEALRVANTTRFAAEAPLAIDTAGETAAGVDNLFNAVRKADNPAVVRHQFFPSRNDTFGPQWSDVLHSAAHDVEDVHLAKERFNLVLRAGLGNKDAYDILKTEYASLADDVSRLQLEYGANTVVTVDPNNPLMRYMSDAPNVSPEYSQMMDQAIEEKASAAARADRTVALRNTLDRVPQVTRRGELRTALVRSEFYQNTRLGRTLRVFADINPVSLVNLHADDIDVQINRFLTNAGVPIETREALRTASMRGGAAANAAVIQDAENAVIDHIANTTGLDPDVLRVRVKAQKEANAAAVSTSRYDASTETTVLRTINAAGEVDELHLPFHPTQFQNYAALPDANAIRKLADKMSGRFTGGQQTLEMTNDALNQFHRLWKPSVLFGTRTPLRIIGEEHIRTMSKFGALSTLMGDARQVRGALADRLGRTPEELRTTPPVARRPVVGLGGVEMPASLVDEAGYPTVLSGELNRTAGGVRQYGAAEAIDRAALLESTKNWVTLTGTDPGHAEAWVNDINNQIRQSPLGQELLANGGDIAATVDWMRTSDEGKRLMRANKMRARDPEGWALSAEDQIQRYLPTEDLRATAAAGPVDQSMLQAAYPAPSTRPNVHGQLLTESLAEGQGWRNVKARIDGLMDKLSTKPDIFLSRQPHYDMAYRAEIDRQVDNAQKLGVTHWTADDVQQITKVARRKALGEVRETLYDLAEYSRFAEAFRFAAPFANASREVITTWAQIALHDPAFVRRMQIVWSSPERAGLIYDSNGNQVHPDGTATAPDGSTVKPGQGRFFRFQAPDWAHDIPVLGKIVPHGPIVVNKESLNTILANPFGVSPLVQIAASRLVDTPGIETALKPFFPYGIDHAIIKPLLPTAARALVDQNRRAETTMRLYNDMVVEYELNGRNGAMPTMAEAKRRESTYATLQALAGITVPTSVRPLSPVQPYIDIYKQMLSADPAHAKDNFIDKYGVEFIAITNAVTRSVDNVQPTLDAWRKRGQFASFIEEHPELGALAVGEVSDPFNTAVYNKQKRTAVGPNDDRRQRQRVPSLEFAKNPNIEAGWYEFGKGMDQIEAARIARGLPNLRIKAAQDLAAYKQQFVAELATSYPDWKADYDKSDPGAYQKRIDGMRELVAKMGPAIKSRPDLQYLGYYLEFRDTVEAALAQRARSRGGSGQLDSASNADLADAWDTGVGRLVEQSPAFGRVWNRYLDHDKPIGHRSG